MPNLNLSPDELLSTTRSVRKRLDLSRQVEPELIQECLELAVQAPTGANSQQWQFVVVTDAQQRQALGAIYQKGFKLYRELTATSNPLLADRKFTREQVETLKKARDSSVYLAEHMHEVPGQVVACIRRRLWRLSLITQPRISGPPLPASPCFMLAT